MVDKRLILAVAGSGKTKLIIDNLNLEQKHFIVTYTNSNTDLINKRIINKFGYFPKNIKVFTYFDFLYNFCVKPFIYFKYKPKGIYLDNSPEHTTYLKNDDINKYLSPNGYLYRNRLSKFIEFENLTDDVIKRLEKFCEFFYYDESQDLGGHDFNFMLNISRANINFLFAGDFYQNTYVTSFDGKTNSSLYKNYEAYKKRFEEAGIKVDTETLSHSHRCSPTICRYITDVLGITINSHRNDETEILLVEDKNKIIKLISDIEIIKLVYDKSNTRHFTSKNWGECKGEDDYTNTCIILNKNTFELYKKGQLNLLANRTKNKLYVAFSRTRGNCYLIEESLLE